MSEAPLLYCPCWDPWKARGKRLVKTKAGSLNQKSKKTTTGGILKDQSKVQLNPSTTSRVKFSTKIYAQPLRSREPQDISKIIEEEITPGFTLSHSKEHIDVTLGEEFFEKPKPTQERIKTPVPGTPPKLETEDVVADLVEQISELTAIIEQLRRDHQVTHNSSFESLEKDMEEKCNEMQEEHDNKMRDIQGFHITEVNNLEEQYKKELRNERATAQEKLATMQKEYKYLKNAFRMYQDSISDEMEEKWLRRQAEWKKSERTEREKALLQQKQSLTKRFETELEEQKKIIQNDSFSLGRIYEKDREEFQQQQQIAQENIDALNAKIKTLENEINEKNETLHAIASTLHKTELELQKEKNKIAEMEKTILQKTSSAEDKYRINIASLTEENNILRRKLLEKNEEVFNERAQKNNIYGLFD
ncbi:flagellum-associated coiled-coil domain-containing protein 1 [Thamnophis elegans]|uniref:flagellum-associated coiled-coil domain-containing protein 1 n=1 Tax=Thamnophis elegans TaxID=35005 RepID=UPI001376A100|nr:flagellum-associated coiled-coil domain-containing protein 1 [Thamnophis elegans]